MLFVVAGFSLLNGCKLGSGGGSDKDGKVRLINLSSGYDSLDLYVSEPDEEDVTRKLESVATGTASDYASLKTGRWDVKFRRTGQSSNLLTESDALWTDGQRYAYVAYGASGDLGAIRVYESSGDAASDETRVMLLNTANTGALDVYITDDDVDLGDATPQFSDLANGSSTSSATTIDSGTYRVRVTGTGDINDVRLDVSGIEFEGKANVSLILTETPGGVLVGLAVLPQQGSLTLHANAEARIRAAVAVGGGGRVGATVGSATLVANAGAGVIGSKYTHVTAGASTLGVTVDGTAVSVPSATLASGGDYTLLIWSNSSGTQTTLVTDDNHPPETSGHSKLRILNGVSGLGVPVTLSADFSPIAEGIEIGSASDYTELTGDSEYQLDVSDTNTTDNLLTRTGVTFQSNAVYTLFVTGGSPVAGTLRKDR